MRINTCVAIVIFSSAMLSLSICAIGPGVDIFMCAFINFHITNVYERIYEALYIRAMQEVDMCCHCQLQSWTHV
jgi:hypothetical protein